jgi:serine/threonine-protein kinase
VASDLFSLGVVLWESLTGKRLFQADTDIEVVQLVKEGRVGLLTRERPSLPLGLSDAVHRSLERDPLRRFPTARSMLETLTEVLRVLPRSVDSRALSASVQSAGLGTVIAST